MNIRFSIGQPNHSTSSVWKLWSKRSDVYLLQRNMGKVQKFSFHESGICRWAQNKPRDDGTDRVILKWNRNPIPPSGAGEGAKLIELVFPTSHLSSPQIQNRPIKWVTPAPLGYATAVEVILTKESQQTVEKAFAANNQRKILDFEKLDDGSYLVISYFQVFCGPVAFSVPDIPDLPGRAFGKLDFPETDENNSGRPIRMLIAKEMPLGDHPVFWELGGFKVAQ